jgi:DNA-binding beta-propeller fold protein YncE
VQKRIIQHVRFAMPRGLVVDPVDGRVYVLHRDGVDAYRAETTERVRLRSHTSTMGNDIWYSLGWWPSQSSLLVGNARSYVTDGEVLVLDRNGNERFRVAVGLNPTAFGE